MRSALTLLIVLAVCAMPVMSSAQAQAGKTLEIYNIDTEGGQATLYFAPSGQTLLVDAGNSGERRPERRPAARLCHDEHDDPADERSQRSARRGQVHDGAEGGNDA